MVRTRWEYRSEEINVARAEFATDDLNQLGEEGWELVSAVPLRFTEKATERILALFKRAR